MLQRQAMRLWLGLYHPTGVLLDFCGSGWVVAGANILFLFATCTQLLSRKPVMAINGIMAGIALFFALPGL
ncbi:hypothetical protein O3W44_23705 [Pantoea sp. LMR881]|nr:hypothetical protein [Pantoea sp. LMR881]MCZ4061500.1 hypothetical protein [Pantoea sp. LMR881]